MKVNITLHPDTATEISTSRQQHPSATSSHTSVYSLIDCYMVECFTIALGAIITYIIILCIHTVCHKQTY